MKALLKINNSELSYRLNLNYNNVYSRLRMVLGRKASLFADISTKSSGTIWYADDDAEYTRLNEAPREEVNALSIALNDVVNGVRKELAASPEISSYVDDILEIPDQSFVFYRMTADGYKFILAGWGCKYAHQSATDPNAGFIKRISKNPEAPVSSTLEKAGKKENISDLLAGIHKEEPGKTETVPLTAEDIEQPVETVKEELVEPTKVVAQNGVVKKESEKEEVKYEKKMQKVVLRVLDQNNHPVASEIVTITSKEGESTKVTSDEGTVVIGKLPYGDSFVVAFPNIQGNQERKYEVEPNVEVYDAYVKKYIKYSPVLFVEDQNGNPVQDYNVKIVINGQDTIYNTGIDGVIQLPTMQEGQKFIAIDTANYANTEEFNVTQAEAKKPYHFRVRRPEKTKVGITVLDKAGNPIPKATVDLTIGDTPCQQITADDGRAEFPYEVFVNGEIPVNLTVKGKGQIKSKLNYTSDNTEYTIQLQDKKAGGGKGFGWKWLAWIPLLLLLGYGGYKLYDKWNNSKVPSIAKMESGVVMTLSQTSYWVDVKVPGISVDGVALEAYYFVYDDNNDELLYGTFDRRERLWGPSSGTGFLISGDGLIATNRHIANPIPPSSMSLMVKRHFQNLKDSCQSVIDNCNNQLHIWSAVGKVDKDYVDVGNLLVKKQEELKIFDKILNTADFTVHSKTKVSVAFTGTRIEDTEELFMKTLQGEDLGDFGFHKCSVLTSGEPGGLQEIDLAIIQLKEKAKDVPENSFIFTVPETDLIDDNLPDDYEITVLGYNAGTNLQHMDLQAGIKPQAQHGKITNTSEKYRVGYDASLLGGSSGSPVLNKEHKLVAINNSGLSQTQGFNYGIRTKYLIELIEKVQGKKNKK